MSPRQAAARGCMARIVFFVAAIAAQLPGATALAAEPSITNPCGPATATAEFTAAANRTGLIDLYYALPRGLPVAFYECFGERAQWLGGLPSAPGSDRTVFLGAAAWECARPARYFAATTTRPDGEVVLGKTSVRTMSCAQRFALEVPATAQAGRVVYVRVVDRWGTGDVQTRLCLRPPDSRGECRTITFAKAADVGTRRFRLRAHGRWRVELHVGGEVVRDAIAVGVRGAPPRSALPTVLATGDSTMQGVDSFLSDDLQEQAEVVSDTRPGYSLSGPNGWAAVADAQVVRLQPDVTVLSIGANEGFPMAVAGGSKHKCCDAGWLAEYARRMRATMLSYARGGLGRVFVLTIPAPRDGRRASVTATVNNGIVLAAEGLAGVRVLRMDLLFSPQGYSDVIHYGDADVHVREADGIHLNVAGTAIAAHVVADAVRAPPS